MWSQGQPSSLTLLVTVLGLLVMKPQGSSATANALDVDEFRRQNSDLSEFMTLVESSPRFRSVLEWKQGTIFAPTNSALDEYRRTNPYDLNNFTLMYHYTNILKPRVELEETSLSTELPGNLAVWITKSDAEYFVNGAKILQFDKNVRLGANGLQQIVHTINKVLEPTLPIADVLSSPYNNPDAKKYLEFSQEYGISRPYNTSIFARHVQKLNRMDFFGDAGKHTFFLPVSEAFATTRVESVDNKAIDGHMVVGKAIFLGANSQNSKQFSTFETSAAAGYFPVEVTIDYSKSTNSWSVTSENLIEDLKSKHRKGKVRAEILKANIPVKNGVVHLISRPLVVIDLDVYKLMQGDGEHGPLQKFFALIDRFPSVKQILMDTRKDHRVTVFAPSSSVLEASNNFKDLLETSKKSGTEGAEALKQLEKIVKLHIVKRDITSEDILNGSKNLTHPFSVRPLDENKQLSFSVTTSNTDGREKLIVMDGGGTSATIKQADIGATNGVIHIVNHVLGLGDNTIYDRLRSDPLLKLTYNLTLQEKFYEEFKKKDKKYTFFAPYDAAWEGLRYAYHSKHRILFEGLHGRHAKNIMMRHLLVGQDKSLEDLYAQSVTGNKTVEVRPISTFSDQIRVVKVDDPNFKTYLQKYGTAHPRLNTTRYHGEYQYVVFWRNHEVRVVQGDIKCTNGYLHIIDTAMMTNDDVVVNSARDILNSPAFNFLLMILFSLLLR